MTKITEYRYPIGGGYADTVAILEDGSMLWINTQYGTVNSRAGSVTGSEADERIADARINGKFGPKPVSHAEPKDMVSGPSITARKMAEEGRN